MRGVPFDRLRTGISKAVSGLRSANMTATANPSASTKQNNYIGGEWLAPSTGNWAPNRNPADSDDVLGQYPVSGEKDALDAIAAAKEAAPGWAAMPGPARGRILAKAVELFRARVDDIARTLCREEGKT